MAEVEAGMGRIFIIFGIATFARCQSNFKKKKKEKKSMTENSLPN